MARKEKTDPGALQRLKNDLRAGQLGPLYLFYGPESYLREHYLALARKKLTDGPAARPADDLEAAAAPPDNLDHWLT